MRKLLDYLLLPLGLWAANYTQFRSFSLESRELYLLGTALLTWFLVTSLLQYYNDPNKRRSPSYRIVVITLFFFGMTGFSFYAQKELDFSRVALVLFMVFQYVSPLLVYGVLDLLHLIPHKGYTTLLVGDGSLFQTVLEEYQKQGKMVFTHPTTLLENTVTLKELVAKNEIQEVVLVTTSGNSQTADKAVQFCNDQGIRCQIILDNKEVSSFPLAMQSYLGRIYCRPLMNRLEVRDNRLAKRIFDFFGSLLILLLISPLLLLIIAIIKLSDIHSPVFFIQNRTGYNQKTFRCYKFRSMKVISQEIADKTQASQNDPRITRFGRFMRRWNLDELPQLFNVIKGEMSLVGPRPHAMDIQDMHESTPKYLLRHFVVPGMTGWAQVNGWRGITDTPEKLQKRIEYDLWYVENWTVWLDLKIMFMTLFSKKSYSNAQ